MKTKIFKKEYDFKDETNLNTINKMEEELDGIKNICCILFVNAERIYDKRYLKYKKLESQLDFSNEYRYGNEMLYALWVSEMLSLLKAFNTYSKRNTIADDKKNEKNKIHLINLTELQLRTARLLESEKEVIDPVETLPIIKYLDNAGKLAEKLNTLENLAKPYENKNPIMFNAINGIHNEGFVLAQRVLSDPQLFEKDNDFNELLKSLDCSINAIKNPNDDSVKALEACAANISGKPNNWGKFVGAVCILGAVLSIGLGIAFSIPTFGIGLAAGIGGAIGLFCLAKSRRTGMSQNAVDLSSELRDQKPGDRKNILK